MSLRVVTPFINTNVPGAYPNVTVQSNPVGLGASGNVVIIGEADGGPSYETVILANNGFTPDQLQRVKNTYISGQIVDAFTAFAAPSNDANINGTANVIYIVKTNTSTKASALVDTDYGVLSDLNYGLPGNQYKFQITSIAAESAPAITSNTIPALGAALNGASFSLRLNGGVVALVTLSATATDHDTIPHLVTELNGLLPSGILSSAGLASSTIVLTMSVDSAAYRKGWGKSLELIDSTPGDLAALGLSAQLIVSAQEPAIEVNIANPSTGLNENIDVNAPIALSVGYQGTTATLTISQSTSMLTTTVTGGTGANISIDMSQYRTISDIATYINAQTGYSASASAAAQQQPPSALDSVAAITIASTAAGAKPGRVKTALSNFEAAIATSTAVGFTATATAGLPAPSANAVFLAGGTRGGTQSTDILNGLQQIAGININIIVPLFSQDSTADIAEGNTSSSSTYAILAINTAVKNHCIQYSTPKLKKNRICVLSYWDDTANAYVNAKQAAQGLANYRCSLTMQKPTQENGNGVITSFLPWYDACIAAGMQAGGFYKSITNKLGNVISYQDPNGFDSGSPGDVEDALNAGLMFMTHSSAGNAWVSDQTTYGYDTNFVYNSMQAVYTSDILALDLAASFQSAFVGQSLADVDAATALSYLAQKMDGYKKLKLIASSNDAPLGYKNAKVSISAPEMDVAVEIKLATAIYFIPISISVSQVQQSAG